MPTRIFRPLLSLILAGTLTGAVAATLANRGLAAEPPRVVASIKPVQALAAAVMRGAGTPGLILSGNASPHAYALRPSDATALRQAELVFWIGPTLEGFLVKPLVALGQQAQAVALMHDTPDLKRLPLRRGGVWGTDDHDHAQKDGHAPEDDRAHEDAGHDDADSSALDAHIWLNPLNGAAMARHMAEVLAVRDPERADLYRANAAALTRDLDALDRALRHALEPYIKRPFIVFHDAYRYFEAQYGLSAAGAITVSPEQRPSARRLKALRHTIRARGAVCVFAEPQFQPALVQTVIEGTGARAGVLDPLGASLATGPDAYPQLLRNLATALREGLEPPTR